MPQRLTGKEKLFVYLVGVVLGLLLLAGINRWRQADPSTRDEKLVQNMVEALIAGSGIRNLPEGSPGYLRDSELYAWHRTYPNEDGEFAFIWILKVEEGHPWIRVVEDLYVELERQEEGIQSHGYRVMRADQVIADAGGLSAGELEARLDSLGFSLGPRLEAVKGWVVNLGEHEIFSVPKGIRELRRELDISATPYIVTRR